MMTEAEEQSARASASADDESQKKKQPESPKRRRLRDLLRQLTPLGLALSTATAGAFAIDAHNDPRNVTPPDVEKIEQIWKLGREEVAKEGQSGPVDLAECLDIYDIADRGRDAHGRTTISIGDESFDLDSRWLNPDLSEARHSDSMVLCKLADGSFALIESGSDTPDREVRQQLARKGQSRPDEVGIDVDFYRPSEYVPEVDSNVSDRVLIIPTDENKPPFLLDMQRVANRLNLSWLLPPFVVDGQLWAYARNIDNGWVVVKIEKNDDSSLEATIDTAPTDSVRAALAMLLEQAGYEEYHELSVGWVEGRGIVLMNDGALAILGKVGNVRASRYGADDSEVLEEVGGPDGLRMTALIQETDRYVSLPSQWIITVAHPVRVGGEKTPKANSVLLSQAVPNISEAQMVDAGLETTVAVLAQTYGHEVYLLLVDENGVRQKYDLSKQLGQYMSEPSVYSSLTVGPDRRATIQLRMLNPETGKYDDYVSFITQPLTLDNGESPYGLGLSQQ